MRTPRSQLTVRRMMLGVAILVLPLGWLAERHHSFATIAGGFRARHEAAMTGSINLGASAGAALRLAWFAEMRDKYDRAARYPWLPVEPDAPEPRGMPPAVGTMVPPARARTAMPQIGVGSARPPDHYPPTRITTLPTSAPEP